MEQQWGKNELVCERFESSDIHFLALASRLILQLNNCIERNEM